MKTLQDLLAASGLKLGDDTLETPEALSALSGYVWDNFPEKRAELASFMAEETKKWESAHSLWMPIKGMTWKSYDEIILDLENAFRAAVGDNRVERIDHDLIYLYEEDGSICCEELERESFDDELYKRLKEIADNMHPTEREDFMTMLKMLWSDTCVEMIEKEISSVTELFNNRFQLVGGLRDDCEKEEINQVLQSAYSYGNEKFNEYLSGNKRFFDWLAARRLIVGLDRETNRIIVQDHEEFVLYHLKQHMKEGAKYFLNISEVGFEFIWSGESIKDYWGNIQNEPQKFHEKHRESNDNKRYYQA